jgi:hypothetical protein
VIYYYKINNLKKHLAIICFFILFFYSNNINANIIRPTTFDERPQCEKSLGMWRDFGNSCADKCEHKFQKYPYCSNAIIYSCDCGKNRCLYEDSCIDIAEYKNIHDKNIAQQQLEQKAYLEDRLIKAKKFKKDYMGKFVGMFNQDPNYRDIYYHQREKPLPYNTFKSNNRILVYNDIIKRKNDKIIQQKKKFEEELKAVENSSIDEEDKQVQIDNLKNEIKKIDETKLLQPIVDKTENNDIVENSEKDKNINDISNTENNLINNAVANTNDNLTVEDNSENFTSKNDFLKRINNFLNKKNENEPSNKIDNKSVENKPIINDDKNNVKIPPVYIKPQNGEADFNNREVIDNSTNFPQFTN